MWCLLFCVNYNEILFFIFDPLCLWTCYILIESVCVLEDIGVMLIWLSNDSVPFATWIYDLKILANSDLILLVWFLSSCWLLSTLNPLNVDSTPISMIIYDFTASLCCTELCAIFSFLLCHNLWMISFIFYFWSLVIRS